MSNDLEISDTAGVTRNDTIAANFRRVAAKAQGNVRFAKFAKGKFKAGADDITGRVYLALVDQLRHGHIKFIGGKVVEERIGKVADGFIEAERDQLGDLDASKWEVDMGGRPRDPWSYQYYLPLLDQETGAAVVFTTSSKGGCDAVANLAGVFEMNFAKLGLPIVRLAVDTYDHKAYGEIATPNFLVVDWNSSGAAAPQIDIRPKAMEAPISTRRNDMDDEIPY